MRSGLFGPWDHADLGTEGFPPGLNPGNKKRWGLERYVAFLEANGRTFVELAGILAGCGLLIGAFVGNRYAVRRFKRLPLT